MNRMKYRMLFLGMFILFALFAHAQQTSETKIGVDFFGAFGSGKHTPFWLTSNTFGKVPITMSNGFASARLLHKQRLSNYFSWSSGFEGVSVTPRYRHFYIQQLYLEASYKCFSLNVGSRERYFSLLDKDLSSGDMVQSSNARPIPEINVSIPQFTVLPKSKGWLQLRGDFAVARSFDTDYLKDFSIPRGNYIKNVLWHHKSLDLRIHDTHGTFPLSAIIGVHHWAQWGGSSTNPRLGRQPQGLGDFVRIVFGREGGKNAPLADQVNVLGNHYGMYDMQLSFEKNDWKLTAYHQHYYEDKSGMLFINGQDGLWGLQIDLPKNIGWLNKVVIEKLETRDQSGPFHFIHIDYSLHHGPGGGSDDYYNNQEYTTGASYFNRSIGSPLIPSPEYNQDGIVGYLNNRVSDWHIGLNGGISNISYRMLATTMNTWGTHKRPFLNKKRDFSALLDVSYHHPRLEGWNFKVSLAGDKGSLFGDNFAVAAGLSLVL